ncbi:outer membrane beta-barrel protein [Phenylobacterium sp. J426]|uniref:outer membrane beta-barrel protein n=1 Tax=Phenylobacterium sp. J426 TaxID=2898439 RepID=UPI0021515F63|nr:outer membrane beta-barrel protein [Phenylobacterium sp. J426]MCR5874650.1 outer membrane beta-barrel protein [Phenylobacterium sp. J426]
MKKNLFAAAAVVAFLGSAVAANAQTIGHVGANYANTNVDISGLGDADFDVWQGEGSVRFDAGSLGAAINGSITDYEGGDTTFGVTGHLNTALTGGLLGGFAGVEAADDVTFWGLGVEGQTNLAPNTTLYGQAGYGTDDESEADLWAVRGELRHYFTDRFKLQGSLGYVAAKGDDAWNAGVEAEYQIANSPLSVLAGYDRFDTKGVEADTFRVGVRYTFGGSIRERDQSGAALGSVAKLFGAGLIR